jgi:heptosyltransferase-2
MSVQREPLSWRIKGAARNVYSWLLSPAVLFVIGEMVLWLLGLRRSAPQIRLSQVLRVVVIRLDSVGDVILMTPFLRELRRNLPKASITLVVQPVVQNIVERCPHVDEVVTFDSRSPRHLSRLRLYGRALNLARRHFWRRRFDLAILPRWDIDHYHGAVVAYCSGARWRVGYSENVTHEKREMNRGQDRLFTHVLNDTTLRHEAERNLDIIRFLGGTIHDDRLELWTGEEDEILAERVLGLNWFRPGELLIAFGPGAGSPHRMWPLVNFLELGNWLKREIQARIVVVGGDHEKPLGEELQRKLGETVINIVGKTTLRQTGVVLRRCQLYVGNDSGPMHLAAAAGVPVAEISSHPQDGSPLHYSSPMRFAPWGVPHCILQPESALPPCSGACTAARPHCITKITVEQVKGAVGAELSSQSRIPIRELLVDLGP